MRNASAALQELLSEPGSMSMRLEADVVRGESRLLQDVPIEAWSFEADLSSKIRTGGSVTIVYQGDFGDSITPRALSDALAPYGSEMHPYLKVIAGEFSERVALGKYRIDGVPSVTESHFLFGEEWLSLGSVVDLRLLDRTSRLERTKFRSLESPPSLTSAYAELVRITGLPLTRTVADVAIPADYVHPRSRIDAAEKLAGILGGRIYMRGDGTLSIIPSTPGAAAIDLVLGELGTLDSIDYSMESEGIVNVVFGDFEDDEGNPIHVEAAITSGDLAVDGPFGEIADEYSGDDKDLIRTEAAAQAAVDADLLARSTRRSEERAFVCQANPLLEIGDVVTVKTKTRRVVGVVTKTTISKGDVMTGSLWTISDDPV